MLRDEIWSVWSSQYRWYGPTALQHTVSLSYLCSSRSFCFCSVYSSFSSRTSLCNLWYMHTCAFCNCRNRFLIISLFFLVLRSTKWEQHQKSSSLVNPENVWILLETHNHTIKLSLSLSHSVIRTLKYFTNATFQRHLRHYLRHCFTFCVSLLFPWWICLRLDLHAHFFFVSQNVCFSYYLQ